jgi:alpha/beta superfamily hydrolase
MRNCIPALLLALACAVAARASAAAPFTLEQIFNPPYPFGTSVQSVSLSDDGAWLACGWDRGARSHRDLWTYNASTHAWYQHTDYWTEREARLRRDFARDLRKAREEWEKAHPPKTEESGNAEKAAGASGAASSDSDAQSAAKDEKKEEQEFDEQKRIDDFEKDLRKQSLDFGGIAQTLFLRGSHEVLWLFDGQVYSLDLDAPQAGPRLRLKHEQGFGGLSLPPRDSTGAGADAVLLGSDADTFLWYPHGGEGLAAGALRQLTTGGYGDRPNDQGLAATPDLHWFAYVTRDYTATRKTLIPDLLAGDPNTTESSHIRPGDTPESASLTLLDLSATPPWPVPVKLPDEPYYNVGQIEWSPLPGEYKLLLAVITIDTRELKVYLVTPPSSDEGEPGVELAYREHDEKWLNWDLMYVGFDCNGGLLLESEKDGKSQLYRLVDKESAPGQAAGEDEAGAPPTTGGQAQPEEKKDEEAAKEDYGTRVPQLLFAAPLEITSTMIFSRSMRAVVQTAEPDPSSRTLYLLDLATGQASPLFPPGNGWRSPVAFNDGETLMAYETGDERRMNNVALLTLPPAGQAPAPDAVIRDRLADGDQTASGWQEWADGWDVRFISVPGPGGPVPVKLYLPPGWRQDGRYPLLLWAHGAGYAQTVTRQPGYLELFHAWAAQERGWICAETDYRGSSGYGRDWRVDVWSRLGEKEVDDLVAVKHYLVDNYGADSQKTALWGWSYGGYLTLMALGMKPGEFPVGCAVAPVVRWENYHQYFAVCRLGLPADNPKEYERSDADTYLKNVTDSLLIIHGLRDSNTVFQSVAQYLEKSHELGIDVTLQLFPSDDHGIGNEHHYLRVFEAVVDFCETHWK